MVPGWFVVLDRLPLTPSQKVGRRALPAPETIVPRPAPKQPLPTGDGREKVRQLAERLAGHWSEVMARPGLAVDDDVFRLGADSLYVVRFQVRVRETENLNVAAGDLFQAATSLAQAARILGQRTVEPASRGSGPRLRPAPGKAIAIIGLAGRLPGARDLDEYWSNLAAGVESLQTFSRDELVAAGMRLDDLDDRAWVRRGAKLDDAWHFEPELFGMTQRDALQASPQFRLFFKVAWLALEQAGYPAERDGTPMGVFAGCGLPNYLDARFGLAEDERLQRLVGNGADYLATRTAWVLGLSGGDCEWAGGTTSPSACR